MADLDGLQRVRDAGDRVDVVELAMIAWLTLHVLCNRWARTALRYAALALAILLFLLSIRRTGEHLGRLADRLEILEIANDRRRAGWARPSLKREG